MTGGGKGSGTFLIILITNKMKIITHFPVLTQLLHRSSAPFSNFLKNPRLTLDQLAAGSSAPIPDPSLPAFNIRPPKTPVSIPTTASGSQKNKSREIKTLNLMMESIANPAPKKEMPVFRYQELERETQIENAVAFMKYLDHSLERTSAIEVVVMVEKYCGHEQSTIKEITSWPTRFEEKLSNANPSDQLFRSIRDHLVHNLNFFSENVQANNQLIDSLFDILAEADPHYITLQNYEQECFTLDEEERRQQVTGKHYFEAACGSKYFDQKESHPLPSNEDKERNKHKTALEEMFQLKDRAKYSRLHLKKEVDAEGKSEPKLKVASDKVVFVKRQGKQAGRSSKEEDLKSAYVYELPYSITEEEAGGFINQLESSKGIRVESFVLFTYKDFIEKNHHEVVFRVPDQYLAKNAPIEKIIKDVEIDEFTKSKPAEKGKRPARKAKSLVDDVPLENQPTRMKSVTDALLLKIKKESYSKFNKSSMLIKFASQQDKETVLTQDARLYGLNYKNFRNVKFQEGYCKSTVSLAGFPWGCGSKELERHLNKVLQPERIAVKVQENCILTKNSIVIQFDYLSEALLAIQKLNGVSYQNKALKAHLTYGSVKLFNNEYQIGAEDSYEKLKKKIQESGTYYQKKYEAEGKPR